MGDNENKCICGREFDTIRGLVTHQRSCNQWKGEGELYIPDSVKAELTVACCLWGKWGDNHSVNYVNKMFRAMSIYLTIPHRFVCFTDRKADEGFDEGIEIMPLDVPSWVGILPKLKFYDPNNGLTGRVLGMDLDKVILQNIDDFACRDEEFIVRAMFKNFTAVGGGMVSFNAGFGAKEIWEPLCRYPKMVEAMAGSEGDERIVYESLLRGTIPKITFWQKILPGKIISYKVDMRRFHLKVPPEDVAIVSFHGKPRPHSLKGIDWVKENWHEL